MPRLIFSIIVLALAMTAHAQPDNKAAATSAFYAANYSQAVELLKKETSVHKTDAEAWLMLGTSYYRLNKLKDAVKAFEKAVALTPDSEVAQINLAMAYLARNDDRAVETARAVLKINKQSAPAHYVLAQSYYREQNYRASFDEATAATRADPKYAAAYFVISRSLVATFVSVRDKAVSGSERSDILRMAVDALRKFGELSTAADRQGLESELKDLNFFADYYSRPENRLKLGEAPPESVSADVVPIKITSKPRPGYTDNARQKNIQGTIILMIGFNGDGKIGPIIVLKSLSPDLDRQAVAAARGIKFVPETHAGVPVSVVKQIEYSFAIY